MRLACIVSVLGLFLEAVDCIENSTFCPLSYNLERHFIINQTITEMSDYY
jgi:hypothetical protein